MKPGISSKRAFEKLHDTASTTFSSNRSNVSERSAKYRRVEDKRDCSIHPETTDSDEDLLRLLDFTTLDDQSAISARFSEIAETLLRRYCIEISTSSKVERLELLEIEFYLYKSGSHEDPFTHASVEQGKTGKWYFHRPPLRSNDIGTPTTFASGYRGGTRQGLDITFGQPAPAASVMSKYFSGTNGSTSSASSSSPQTQVILRGGILLRSVRRASDNKVISGPSLLVDEVLRLSSASKISDLVVDIWENDISVFRTSSSLLTSTRRSTMHLVCVAPTTAQPPGNNGKDTTAIEPHIYRSPRIGLDISHPSISPDALRTHPRVLFVGEPYRFFVCPQLLTANGRGQTFLGVYDAEVHHYNTHYDVELLRQIENLTGWKFPKVKRCFAEYAAGLEGHCDKGRPGEEVLRQWLGKKGKGVGASMTGWLRMIGTLRMVLKSTPATAADTCEG